MLSTLHAQSLQDPKRLYIFIVGGCGEFGMNLTIYAHQGQCLIVDCGLSFAEPYEIGIDAHIPAWEDLEAILGCKPTAYLITHGHEDHLGALPYFLANWPAPVYIGPWAQELLRDKLRQKGDDIARYKMHEMIAGEKCQIGSILVDWIHVPHSIPDCCSLSIDAGDGLKIFHTGDFKLQGFKAAEPDMPLDLLANMAKAGPFLAMVADSTNALTSGHCPSEDTVLSELQSVMAEATGISYVTTFSSNLWRIKTVLIAAKALNKRVFAFGAGIRRSLENGTKLRLLGDEATALIDEDGAYRLDRKDLIVLCSGCQGEFRSGLKRIICDEVGQFRINSTDQIIFSSRVIPGNEKNIFKLISLCHQKGARVVTARERSGIHVSGHAYADDLVAVLEAVKPRFYMPVHGTFTQIRANQALMPNEDSIIDAINGLLVAVCPEGFEEMASYELEPLFVDSWSRMPMRFEMMRSRHKIGDSGLALVSGVLGPVREIQLDLDFVGLPFKDLADEEKCEAQLINELKNLFHRSYQHKDFSAANFNEQARLLIRRVLTERFIKKPVVISKIFSV